MSACPVCGSGSIALSFTGYSNRNPADGRSWPVFKCGECEHGFVNPQPTTEELAEFYNSSYEAYDDHHAAEEGDDAAEIAKARELGRLGQIALPAGKRVLDLGCGGGRFLRLCRALGASRVQGIELSPHGAHPWAGHSGLRGNA